MDEFDEFEDLKTEEGDDQRPHEDWARLRREQNARKKALREADDAKREAAFLRAGIDPDNERMKYFVKGYEGESDPEAIKAAAIAAGFMAPPEPPQPDPAVQQMTEGLQRVDAAASGATPPDGSDPVSALDAAYQGGGDRAVEEQLRQMGVPIRYSS